MGRMFKAFGKQLFGTKYEGLGKALLAWLAVFLGVRGAGVSVRISPAVLYLTGTVYTAGVMWQALSARDQGDSMKNVFMLPFEGQSLVAAYVAALGLHTLLTKTAGVLAVMLALSPWRGREILGSILCGINGSLMAACIYSRKKWLGVGLLWGGAVTAAILWLWDRVVFLPMLIGSCLLSFFLLYRGDAYSFYGREDKRVRRVRRRRGHFLWRYLFRYLATHKNYLVNTAALWVLAWALPDFLGQMEQAAVMPMGFAILSLNTPLCILLSCDRDLERAVRFLLGQGRGFCIPYGLFLFLWDTAADGMFLLSWRLRWGGVERMMIGLGFLFALGSALGSVLLEWFCPLRDWKTESDLWHHPRKYVVPAGMLLLAGAVSTWLALVKK